ncbi:hypothetical protein [Kitasatospora sp. NPDC056184]|uniref:hypothetical protein n=1 Tax=Kitasatospora sp. NPDC056184 TaxID=3345738 RepID=UPI0035D77802
MSYDVSFLDLRRYPSVSEAIEAREGQSSAVPQELAEAWQRITPRALELLGDAEVGAKASWLGIGHDPSGLQLSAYGAHVSMSVPYWHRGEQAERVMALVYGLAGIVEEETGLSAYDPQTGDLLTASRAPEATAMMNDTATWLEHY